jgi:DNA primase
MDEIQKVLALHSHKLIDIALQACDGIGITLKHIGNRWQGVCPLHDNSDNPTAFVIYEDGDKQRWTCFTHCGHGDIIDFVVRWKHISLKEAIEYLNVGINISHEEMLEITRKRREEAERYEAQKKLEYEAAVKSLNDARKWENYHNQLDENENKLARNLWRVRGVPDTWQDIWELGYCDCFKYKVDDTIYSTPTLAIPIRDDTNRVTNIKHRLLNPVNPKDKYRDRKSVV